MLVIKDLINILMVAFLLCSCLLMPTHKQGKIHFKRLKITLPNGSVQETCSQGPPGSLMGNRVNDITTNS